MRKLAVLTVIVLMTLNGLSQTSKPNTAEESDLTCIPNGQLKTALKVAVKYEYCEQENKVIREENTFLHKINDKQDSTISIQDQRINAKDKQIEGYKSNEVICEVEKSGLKKKNEDDKKAADKLLKQQKRKTTLWKIVSVGVAGGAAYLLLK